MNQNRQIRLVCKIAILCFFLLIGTLAADELLFPPTPRELNLVRTAVRLTDLPRQDSPALGKVVEGLDRVQALRRHFSDLFKQISKYDPEVTAPHCRRVGRMAARFYEVYGSKRGLNVETIDSRSEVLRWAGTVHDQGKLSVSLTVLNKPGSLNATEYSQIQQHSKQGRVRLDGGISGVEQVSRSVSLFHHERWDGKGYPQGLKAKNIPLSARLVSIVDVYDSLTQSRSYKDAWPMDKVLSIMKQGKGSQFDPKLLQLFLDNRETISQAAHKQEQGTEARLRLLADFRKMLHKVSGNLYLHSGKINKLGRVFLRSWGFHRLSHMILLPSSSLVGQKKNTKELDTLFEGLNRGAIRSKLLKQKAFDKFKAKIYRIKRIKR